MYCIIKIENHPDAGIETVFGPYETFEEADQQADIMEAAPENINKPYKHRLYHFIVSELEL